MSESAGITCLELLSLQGKLLCGHSNRSPNPCAWWEERKRVGGQKGTHCLTVAPTGTHGDVPGPGSEPHRHPGTAFIQS